VAPLTKPMQQLITQFSAGAVATVNDDGTPAVSPKATFVVVDDSTLAFGSIRSPGTVANLRKRPAVEVNFIDVVTRRAVRVAGEGRVIEKDADDAAVLLAKLEESFAPYIEHMSHFVRIDVTHAELILSPAYDIGLTVDELRRANLDKLNNELL